MIAEYKPQIAVKEAIPFEEFKQNPYAVLCTTSMGGHLSWFETGGGRWFAKPVGDATGFMSEHELTYTVGNPIPHEDGRGYRFLCRRTECRWSWYEQC